MCRLRGQSLGQPQVRVQVPGWFPVLLTAMNKIMNTKEIKPKTLVAVLAAAIKEDAEYIAKSIVETAKSDNVEYASLVETFILNKRDADRITFSSFAENAFEQIKDIKELKDFSVEIECKWRRDEKLKEFVCALKNEFSIRGDLDIVTGDNWSKSAYASGNNIYTVFEEFKERVKRKTETDTSIPTEVNLPTDNADIKI